MAVTAVALLGVAVTYLLAPLNGNIRYEAGVKEVVTASAAGTFSHRPLAFRMLIDGVFRLANALSVGTASFEFMVRVLVAAMAVVLATAGTGVALLGRRRPWPWALLAGVFFVAAGRDEGRYLATALLGLAVVALVDRRQPIRAWSARW